MVLSNDIDLLNPKPDLEKRRHKLKRLVQSQTPSSCSTIVFLLACLPVNETASHSVFCDGTFFPSLHDEMSAIVGCFNRRAQNLLQVHLSSGFRKYFTWIKRKLVKGNHVAMVEEGKKGLLHIFAGYAVGGGHVLHMVCDLTIAADNAVFGQTGPKVGSLDAGYGSFIMSRLILSAKDASTCRTTVFSHSQTVVVCGNCQTVLCQPTGGKARLTEGCSFWRKGD
ncbi:hypothetical protein C5167_002981 [Papaver somniferum]|uniref:Uncharacterized protein n=1 Tax=Papaver somniferum TaxID=3469 RepID=A0A4Y7L183_PAPSO|nr:hypothetical protein C5167_002981 [Papaver somniferum]